MLFYSNIFYTFIPISLTFIILSNLPIILIWIHGPMLQESSWPRNSKYSFLLFPENHIIQPPIILGTISPSLQTFFTFSFWHTVRDTNLDDVFSLQTWTRLLRREGMTAKIKVNVRHLYNYLWFLCLSVLYCIHTETKRSHIRWFPIF